MHPPLFQAASEGDDHFVRELARTNHNRLLFERTVDGNSVLHIAAKLGHVKFASVILSDARFSSLMEFPCNSRGNTPLHCAAAAGHSAMVIHLIQHEHGRQLLLSSNLAGDTVLHEAARNGHISIVKVLMSAAEELSAVTNKSGTSALYMAAERGSKEIVRILLKSLKASHEGPRGQTALHAAVLRSYDITTMILEAKPSSAKCIDASISTPLHFAATAGDVKMVKLLLEFDPSVAYAQDEDGLSAIHVAASEGHVGIIDQILSFCPDAREQRNGKGRNLLHLAIEKKRLQVVKYSLRSPLLVELVNEPDNEGNTPLHLAVILRRIQIIHVLTSHGSTNMNVMNNEGFMPVDLACSNAKNIIGFRMYNIIAVLISRGSRPSPQRYDLTTKNSEVRNQEGEVDRYRALCNNLSIIAVLVATVTFAAAFTLPGGYNSTDQGSSDLGMATLSKRAAFKAFLISDTLAMTSSITVTILLMHSASVDHDVRLLTLQLAMKLMEFAVCGMLVAFAAGVYVVVAHDSLWVSILVCIIVSVPFSEYVVSYLVSTNNTAMSTAIKLLMLGKELKWLGLITNKVLPAGDEGRGQIQSFLMRHKPQRMAYVS